MTFRYLLLTGALAVGLLTAASAQTPDTASAKRTERDIRLGQPAKNPEDRPSFIPAPVIFYEPETGFAAGATFLPTWRHGRDTTVRKSNGRIGGWYSQKKQLNLQLSHTIFTRREAWLVSGDLLFYDYPIFFYGIGNDTDIDDESEISYKVLTFNQRGLKQAFIPGLFLGLTYRYTDTRDIIADKPTVNDGDKANLLLTQVPAEQRLDTRISGLGPAVVYDTRDNVLSTFRGNYVDVQALLNRSGLGSDYNFTRYQLDARHFQPLRKGSNRTILAGQVLGQFNRGNVPFRELAGLGGITVLRGIYEGRFRDRQLLMGQAELRHHLFWRLNGAVFAGVGQVAPRFRDFGLSDFNYAAGGGLRFQFNRRDRINIRFDYGVGSGGSSGLYFGVNEAF
ncbi:BamA/TamA family outer membrane protein [Hymenobacter busanensis]|uniref:BamA/TamA family outer membrane protein n=1 Tax=Hymenobacter busanensis TaxID=2607656 RepID=A0A7L4ZW53_9BACT|nr:BamA/TamA family outer membrane protein [Hymenobacter busanensis]KAA9325288.1 BamA/TamA family outer membrane protein [Hymenobacter busanensis]QHJ07719.1 BamA/TamA family outer membrane protein [Hymenobacter busanensis]